MLTFFLATRLLDKTNNFTEKRTTKPERTTKQALTFPGGLKAVEDVYSLDVIGQRGVGEQCAIPVDCVQGKFKG